MPPQNPTHPTASGLELVFQGCLSKLCSTFPPDEKGEKVFTQRGRGIFRPSMRLGRKHLEKGSPRTSDTVRCSLS